MAIASTTTTTPSIGNPSGGNILATSPATKQQQPAESLRDAFQKFVAGTFYKQMMKAMRKMHDKPAYFHGGQAEEMFQSQMDQYVSEDLSAKHGEALAEPLFQTFAANLSARRIAPKKNATRAAQRVEQPVSSGTLSRRTTTDTLTESAMEARLAAAQPMRR